MGWLRACAGTATSAARKRMGRMVPPESALPIRNVAALLKSRRIETFVFALWPQGLEIGPGRGLQERVVELLLVARAECPAQRLRVDRLARRFEIRAAVHRLVHLVPRALNPQPELSA